jgi:expansin (peptidoglycan-binding protein)
MEALNSESGQNRILSFLEIPQEERRLQVGLQLGASPLALQSTLIRLRELKDYISSVVKSNTSHAE